MPRTRSDSHAHHHDHPAEHAAEDFVAAVERSCDERGLRLTPLRRVVLELIAHEDKPIKAYDLLERLRGERARAAPPTVYRALDFLLEQGYIHKLESINAYTRCPHPAEQHSSPFFICDRCASAIELCDPRVAAMLTQHAAELGFAPKAQTLEVHGLCRSCQQAVAH